MKRRCRAFPSEYQKEYIKFKIPHTKPIRPVENWEPDESHKPKPLDKNAEALLNTFMLDRLKTIYQVHYKEREDEEHDDEEEIDSGSELITYLKNLYHNPDIKEVGGVLYTTARVFGYSSPQNLRPQLSTYQDTFGRTGGQVILKNVKKIKILKRRQIIEAKLREASLEQ